MASAPEELDPAQRAAVDSDHRRLLILAGAGTGKTTTLTHRLARLVGGGIAPASIVLVTFTNRAAREMVRRVEGLLGPKAHGVRAGTFHALAFRALRQHGHVLGLPPRFSILDREGAIQLMGTTKVPDVSPRRLVEILSLAVNVGAPLDVTIRQHAPDLKHAAPLVLGAADRFADAKAARGLLDFDDLLVAWNVLLGSETPEAASMIDETAHVLVDEYQDTNRLQAEIASKLAAGGHLAVVGDDNQSIFGFRGARHDNILEFAAHPGTEVHRLTRCYRSTPEVVLLANAVVEKNQRRLDNPLTSTRPSGPKPMLVSAATEDAEAQFIAARVLELRDAGVPLETQVVLHRAHRHVDPLTRALDRRGIPYRLRTGARYFERPPVRDLLAALRVIVDPTDLRSWRRVLRAQSGIGARTVDAVAAEIERAPGPADTRLHHAAARAAIPAHLGLRVAATARTFESIIRAENVAAAVAAATELVEDRDVAAPLVSMAAGYADLDSYLAELALSQEATTTDDDGRLTLSTVHQAKGLEWRAVFILHLVDGLFPSQGALDDPAAIEEERRLLFVAITRAEDMVHLTHPESTDRIIAPTSRFLTELDRALVQHVRVEGP